MQSHVGQVDVRLLGVTFIIIVLATTNFSQNMLRKMNDFDGDGKTDFAVTRREGDSKIWYIWQSRDGFKAFQWGLPFDVNAAGDYDGDGKTDITVFRPVNFPPLIHYFWIWNSGSNNLRRLGLKMLFLQMPRCSRIIMAMEKLIRQFG